MLTKNGIRVVCMFLAMFVIRGAAVGAENGDVRTKVPHISAYEALELFKAGRLILLDVHIEKGKTGSSIVGASYVPANKIERIKLKVPETILIGVFCD